MQRDPLPSLLESIEPMLLTELKRPFDDDAWLFELKYDGYRLLSSVGPAGAHLMSRGGANATRWFPEIVAALQSLPKLKSSKDETVFDGEVCVLDAYGRSDFDLLHQRALARRWKPGLAPVVYCVFDVLVERGKDLRSMPLKDRKERLRGLIPTPAKANGLPLLLVGGFVGTGVWLFEQAKALELEGIVAKRLDSTYAGDRSPHWIKIKRKGATPAQRFTRPPRKDLGEP